MAPQTPSLFRSMQQGDAGAPVCHHQAATTGATEHTHCCHQHQGDKDATVCRHQAATTGAPVHTHCCHDDHAHDVQGKATQATDAAASAQNSLMEQAIQYTSHTISMTAQCSSQEARVTLCKYLTLCGDLTVAAQRACQELLDGTPGDTGKV